MVFGNRYHDASGMVNGSGLTVDVLRSRKD